MAKRTPKKSKDDNTFIDIFNKRVAEFSSPEKRSQLWERSRGALANVMDGGSKILDGVLTSFRDNGLSAADKSYRAVQDAQSNYAKLRQALLRQAISAERFDKSYRQIRETMTTKFKAIEQKDIRKIAMDVDKAVNDGVGMVLKLVGKVFNFGG